MKILLDECLPLHFRQCFDKHEVHSVYFAGLNGKSNGELIAAAEAAGYDVLLTVDHGFPHQRPSGSERLAIMVLRVPTNQMEDLLPMVGHINAALQLIQPGEIIEID